MTQINAALIYAFVFFAGWTDAFGLGSWLPIYSLFLVAAVFISFLLLVKEKLINLDIFAPQDIFLVITFMFVILSAIINPNPKSANYILAYFYIFGVQYFFLKHVLYSSASIANIYKINAYAILFTAGFSIFEFLAELLLGFNIQNYIPRDKAASASYNVIFSRSYGFATEPTVLGFYLNTLGPLAIASISKWSISSLSKKFLYLVCFLGWLFTFSTSSFIILPAAIAITLLLSRNFNKVIFSSGAMFVYATVIALTLIYSELIYSAIELFSTAWSKATFDIQYTSVSQRLNQIELGMERVLLNPIFGIGIGQTSNMNEMSSINWYLFLATEIGIIGVLFLLLFLATCLLNVINSNLENKWWIFCGLLSGCVHLATLSTFYNPFVWILLSIFFIDSNSTNSSRDSLARLDKEASIST